MKTTSTKRTRVFGPAAGYRIVDASAVEVLFERNGKKSPYLLALQQLIASQKENPERPQYLEFERTGARPSIYAQARKHGIKVMFAEKDGKLYVRLEAVDGPEAVILKFLLQGPKSLAEMSKHLEDEGHRDVKLQPILTELSENQRIALRDHAGAKKWTRL